MSITQTDSKWTSVGRNSITNNHWKVINLFPPTRTSVYDLLSEMMNCWVSILNTPDPSVWNIIWQMTQKNPHSQVNLYPKKQFVTVYNRPLNVYHRSISSMKHDAVTVNCCPSFFYYYVMHQTAAIKHNTIMYVHSVHMWVGIKCH